MRPLFLVLVVLALTPVAAAADSRWTFCVASASPTRDVWISEVFATALDRERIEGEFKAAIIQTGARRVVAQCPAARDDKTEAINDRFGAVEFNRQLGADVRALSSQQFPPRR